MTERFVGASEVMLLQTSPSPIQTNRRHLPYEGRQRARKSNVQHRLHRSAAFASQSEAVPAEQGGR